MTEHELQGLRDQRLPGGTTAIERWENHLFCDAMGVEPLPDGLAHPAFLFHLPLRGVGMDIAGMLALGRPDALLLYALGFVALQIGANAATAAYQALLPDLVPVAQRGEASGYLGLMTMLGTAASFAAAARSRRGRPSRWRTRSGRRSGGRWD
jgi:hypothetical protein